MITEVLPYQESPLFDSMFRHRGEQFVSRLKWDVGVDASGRERDQFDDEDSFYLIQHDDGQHMASMRCRWMKHPTLISEVFPEYLPLCNFTDTGVEVTRFCAAPGGVFEGRELLYQGWKHARSIDADVLYGIFTPAMPRIYRKFGWEPEVLGGHGKIRFGVWDVRAKKW